MSNLRLVTLSDGTGMGDYLYVFKTNTPADKLKELEKISCQVYLDGGDAEDVPIWAKVLRAEGYTFEYVDEHRHITGRSSSGDWLEDKYPQITEHYQIENQPQLV